MNVLPTPSIDVTALDYLCFETVTWVATTPVGIPTMTSILPASSPFNGCGSLLTKK